MLWASTTVIQKTTSSKCNCQSTEAPRIHSLTQKMVLVLPEHSLEAADCTVGQPQKHRLFSMHTQVERTCSSGDTTRQCARAESTVRGNQQVGSSLVLQPPPSWVNTDASQGPESRRMMQLMI